MIGSESPRLEIQGSPVVVASRNHTVNDFESTPVEFPELREIDVKISDFYSPLGKIASEGRIQTIEDFLLTEITEFDAQEYTSSYDIENIL